MNTNFPLAAPANLLERTTITSESGANIRLELPVRSLQQECEGRSYLEVRAVRAPAWNTLDTLFQGFVTGWKIG